MKIENAEALGRLDGLDTLAWETVERRFHYRGRPGLHLLLLKVFRLPTPHWIENRESYEGCVSEVQLENALSTSQAESVLSTAKFEAESRETCEMVGASHTQVQGMRLG